MQDGGKSQGYDQATLLCQIGDTIVERVREAIAFNTELADDSVNMVVAHVRANGVPLESIRWGRARGESRGFRQQPKGTSQLSCVSQGAITEFVLDENRECCNNKFKQTLMLLHNEWSKEIEPSRQNSTHYPHIISKPIDKKGPEFMRRNMQWEAPAKPMAAYDPGLLREQETPLVIGKNWYLDQEIPASDFVRILDSSQVWKE